MNLFTYKGRTLLLLTAVRAALAILITLPISTPCQQLSLPQAHPPLMLAQTDNSWMTPEEREKLGIKEEPKPKPQPRPNPQPQQESRKSNDDREYGDYEYSEYGTMVPKTSKPRGYYSSSESISKDFINYKARNAVLWAIVFPGGGNFSIGRPGWGTVHFSIQVLPLLVSYIGYNSAVKDFEKDAADPAKYGHTSPPTTSYIWYSWIIAIASKVWDAYGSYNYTLEPNQ